MEWLSETVAEAARTADQHEALKRLIRELRASVEARFRLAAVQVGPSLCRAFMVGVESRVQLQDRVGL